MATGTSSPHVAIKGDVLSCLLTLENWAMEPTCRSRLAAAYFEPNGTVPVSNWTFPSRAEEATEPPPGLLESLNVASRYVGRNQFDYLVELESEEVVRSLSPDFKRLGTVKCRGVIVTALSSDPQFDFVSRFFAPAEGIDEDPVTGSAHCSLAEYWGERLNKAKMVGYQASARGGIVHVEVRGERVMLGGEGVIFAEGELMF